MKVLIFGSRSLTWKHLPAMRAIADHAFRITPPPPGLWMMDPEDRGWACDTCTGMMTLLNGDGPPGREHGAIGADKLALLACMESWTGERRVRWFPPEPKDGETWAQAAVRRNRDMVDAKPERAYCIHTDLDRSKGSLMTANLLTQAGIRYWYVRVKQSGEVASVEGR